MSDDGMDALAYHSEHKGKIAVEGTVSVEDEADLSRAYTPGVAEAVKAIQEDESDVYEYTSKGRMVGVMTDGSSVLGMGDTGGKASIPVMEGKALLMRKLADVSAFPVVVDCADTKDIVAEGRRIHPMFGFLMLEDIASPACFTVEERLKEELEIPVFHDDQHGIAIAVLAGLMNAGTVVGNDIDDMSVVVVGAGAAGIATAELLYEAGIGDITVVDKRGILHAGYEGMNWAQEELAATVNDEQQVGDLADALVDADAVVGLSTGGIISKEMIRSMEDDPIVFALANPEPEIMPEEANEAGAAVVATGRSDYPNQINNVLVFPGIVKGCLSCFASDVTTPVKIAAASALAKAIDEPSEDNILPNALERRPVDAIAEAVASEADVEGLCRTEPF